MKILVDENCGPAFRSRLANAGHDVKTIRDIAPGVDDGAVFAMARAEGRVLLTHDRGFGNLAEQANARPPAILLMRLRTLGSATCAKLVVQALAELGDSLEGHFVVIEPRGIRTRSYKE